MDAIASIWFFIIFIPGIYLTYTSLQCFDFAKLLRNGKVKDFKIIYFMLSVIIAFLFAKAFTEVIERITGLFRSLFGSF